MLRIVYPVCCGLDVHKSFVFACIAATDENGVTTYQSKKFSTFTNELKELAEWLARNKCRDVCMESSGKYWIPIKEIEARQKEITELQKQIATYGKTRDVYAKYKASGWSRDFYDIHASDIILHRAAKKYFEGLGKKKLPSINQLKQEYATLASERKTLYSDYHKLKDLSRELTVARANAERILGVTPDAQNRDASHSQNQHNTNEL